jgi:hypothetical protein
MSVPITADRPSCTTKPYPDAMAAGRAWHRMRRLYPKASEGLKVEWCGSCWAYHLVAPPRLAAVATELPRVGIVTIPLLTDSERGPEPWGEA